MVSAVPTSDLNLDLCAQESFRHSVIEEAGSIQPHGMLVVVDPDSRQIVQASANAAALLGNDRRGTVLGSSLRQLIGDSAERQITASLCNPDSNYSRTLEINGQRLQVLGHLTAQGVILEFEQPPASEGETLEAHYSRIGRFMEDVPAHGDLADLCNAAAREFRQISGFNRVLIYRFDAEWNGEVLAEDGDGVLPSYLGLRFPASDIPPQARELYRLNRLHVIPDANHRPVPLEPEFHPRDGKRLDLSFAALRSVSPVHLQYMRNMGTLASLSISVLMDGKLWGLVSCHNAMPRRVNAQARTACDLLGKVLSQHIRSRQIGIINDITERKVAERDHLWQLSQDLLAVMTPSGALIEVNPAWQTSLGYRADEVVGQPFWKLAYAEDADVVMQAVSQASQEKRRPFECRFNCNDGETRWLSWSAAPGHGCIYVVGRDITEDKAAQEALRQSQKMEAVGQLTGGLAHDFNNLLQIIVGNIETLQRKLPPDLDRLRRAADHAMAGAERATNLAQHLLAISRKQPLDPRPVAVNRLVLGMSQMLQRTLGELIEIETSLAPELCHVEIDSNQLEIALLNLAVNARDAMPDDGEQVRISSTDGVGTSVRIYLPAARPDAKVPDDEQQCELPALARRETILVVEDDADVRAFTVETVRELGYDVLEARDGNSALNVLRQTPADEIDLLFSDVVLPGGINGQQLAQQALELHPRMKVLFATGYAREVIVHHGRLDPGVQLITKPFAFEALATRLRSVLDGQDSSQHVN